MIYLIILLLMLAAVYAFDLRGYKPLYSFSYWGFFVVLVVLVGLRYRIGTDSIVYERTFEKIPTLAHLSFSSFDKTRFEPGFIVFESFSKTISSEFIVVQFLHAIVLNLVIFWFIFKNTTHRFLCLTFYFIVLYLNLNTQVLRESLAVSCFLLAWPFFRDNKWIQYYLLAILACFFHTSAFLLLVLPLICLPGIRKAFVIGKRTIIISLVILILGIVIESQFSAVFSAMAVTERMMDRVNEYAHNDFGGNRLNIIGALYALVHFTLYPFVALYFLRKQFKYTSDKILETVQSEEGTEAKKEIAKEKRRFNRWEMLTVMGIYFTVLSIPMFIFGRYFNYFGMFCLATVSTWMFSKIHLKTRTIRLKLAYWIAILIPFYIINLVAYNSPINRSGTLKDYMIYYPYTTRMEPEMYPERESIYRYLDAR